MHPVVSVDTDALDALPRLETTRSTASRSPSRFPTESSASSLRTATAALLAPQKPPRSISPIEDDVPTDAVRRAANHLVFSTTGIAGETLAKGLFDSFEALASTAYEGPRRLRR